jgi:hypothetical protein
MYNLYLDDMREAKDAFFYTENPVYLNYDWIVVRTYDEFVEYIKLNGLPELVSFDHDLADEHYNYLNTQFDANYNNYVEKTGYECVKWLCDYCLDNNKIFPKSLYHTQNLIGRINMEKYVKNFRKYNEQ